MALLTAVDFAAVRAALDVVLDQEDLPDEVIALDLYQGAAEAEVLRRIPDATTREGWGEQAVKRAAILLTAALLAPAVPQLIAETLGTYRYQRGGADWAARAAILRQRAEGEIRALVPDPPPPIRPTFFAAAPGGRGR